MNKLSLFIVLSILCLAACDSGGDKEFATYLSGVRARTTLAPEPLPNWEKLKLSHYVVDSFRPNPFRLVKSIQSKGAQGLTRGEQLKASLVQFPLKDMHFVGTLKKGEDTWGLVHCANGAVLTARLGDLIGKNNGRIIAITEELIRVEERIRIAGKWTKIIKKLMLVPRV